MSMTAELLLQMIIQSLDTNMMTRSLIHMAVRRDARQPPMLELTVWHVNIRNSFTVISQDTVSTSQMVAMAIPIPAVVGMMRISTFVNKTTSKGGL